MVIREMRIIGGISRSLDYWIAAFRDMGRCSCWGDAILLDAVLLFSYCTDKYVCMYVISVKEISGSL